jgi:hypothetical protein
MILNTENRTLGNVHDNKLNILSLLFERLRQECQHIEQHIQEAEHQVFQQEEDAFAFKRAQCHVLKTEQEQAFELKKIQDLVFKGNSSFLLKFLGHESIGSQKLSIFSLCRFFRGQTRKTASILVECSRTKISV